jgi:2-dehydropantoate 2-reductase
MRVAVLGAGAIGTYVGGRLAQADADVVLVGRARPMAEVAAHGLWLGDLRGEVRHVAPSRLRATSDPAGLDGAEVVLLAVKGRDLPAALGQVRAHAPNDALVVSLLNGVEAPDEAAAVLGPERVCAGMVAFNVPMGEDPTRLAQATSGPLVIGLGDRRAARLVSLLRAAGVDARQHGDMRAVLWSKHLYNLNNAINALSGLPIRAQMADRALRRVLAAAMREGLAVAAAIGVRPAFLPPLTPRLAVRVLPAPDCVFSRVARAMIELDPEARGSMQQDLVRGKPSEVDRLNGVVVRLGAARSVPTPVNAALVELVRRAEAQGPGYERLDGRALLGFTMRRPSRPDRARA